MSQIIHFFRHKSLRRELMLGIGQMLFLSLLVVVLIACYFIYRIEEDAWRGRQGEAARNASQTIFNFIDRAKDRLTLIGAEDPDHLPVDPEFLDVKNDAAFLEIIRVSSEGSILASTYQDHLRLGNPFTLSQSIWFIQAMAGQSYFGNVQFSYEDEPYLIFSVPAGDGGVVAARMSMKVLWQVVDTIQFGERGQAYVINQSGEILAHTARDLTVGNISIQDQPEFIEWSQDLEQEWYSRYTNFQGRRVVGVAEPIAGTPWVVITEVPVSEAFYATRLALLLFSGSSLFIFFQTMLWLRRHLVKTTLDPLSNLRAAVERIGHGDYSYRIGAAGENEIGQIASSFNTMAEQLSDRSAQLLRQTKALELENAERKKTEAIQKISEARYRAIVEDQTELICRWRPPGILTFVNEAYCRYFSATRDELLGQSFLPMIDPQDVEWIEKALSSLSIENPVIDIELRVILPDGTSRWHHWTDRAIFGDNGEIIEYAAVGRDISDQKAAEESLRQVFDELEQRVHERTAELERANWELRREIIERLRAEEQISTSLQEKEVLLKEIHHRVKNNLQVISSLLSLQLRRVHDPDTIEALRESQNRVRSMALIHEALYQSNNLAQIDFADYVRHMVNYLIRSYAHHTANIEFEIEVEKIFLSVDTAVPCGLILNELVSNVFKHAFPNGQDGKVWIQLRISQPGLVEFIVRDNGVGIPENWNIRDTKSLGMQLVQTLAAQIKAGLSFERAQGTAVQIRFNAS